MTIYVSDTIQATAAPVTANPESARSWQWNRNGAPIEGATSSSYQVADADEGASIDVTQIESNIVGTAKATSNALGPVVPFEPIALYKNNTVGAWYDPSDLTTMFQDAAGTTPITAVEQPVGLMLDKSRELTLGPELVTNGTFDTDTDWTKQTGWSISSGVASVSTSTQVYLSQSISSATAGYYEVRFTIPQYTSGTVRVAFSGTYREVSASGSYTFVVNRATSGGTSVQVYTIGTTALSIDNISVRELPGNHAYQSTSTARPVFSRRYNLLTKTEQFDDGVWGKVNSSITSTSIKDPLGTNLAQEFTTNSIANPELQSPAFSAVASVVYTSSIYVKYVNSSYIRVITPVGSVWYTITSNSVIVGTNQVNSAQAIDVGDGWYRLVVTFTAASTASAQIKYTLSLSDGNSTEVIGSVYIWGASLVPANQSSLPYQRVNTSTDYDSDPTKFPSYLRFDGVDDFLVTNTIDFTSTDKMTVFAGVRKVAVATTQMIAELSADLNNNNGSIYLLVSNVTDRGYAFSSKGTVSPTPAFYSPTTPSTETAVITATGSISEDYIALRRNGVDATPSTSDQGTGNFGNYPLYIGRRGGTTLPFNGHIYGLIVRGAQTNSLQIEKTEEWLANKTGITI